MTPPDVSESYAKLLRRGRTTLLLITLMVGLAESVVVLTTLATRGSQSAWQLALGVVLSLLLLRAVYRGHELARWLLALLMGLLFVWLLVIAERDSLMGAAKIVVDDSTITSHIKRIRKKFLALDPAFDCIATVYGMGYRWSPQEP